jgi:hypothetical protein
MNRLKKWIYSHSQKPSHYKEVKKPCRGILAKITHPQTARQQLYNKWCKEHQYYSGSYLPYKDSELVKQGWKDNHKSKVRHIKEYIKKSLGQSVAFHKIHVDKKSGKKIPTHYHWDNPDREKYKGNINNVYYLDKYGLPCARDKKHNNPSHIKPHHTRRKKK